MRVFVLDAKKRSLDPCHPARARQLLKSGRAVTYRYYPFTIILKDRLVENSVTHPHRVKIDPGAKVTGLALVRDDISKVVWAAELEHRGEIIHQRMLERASLRRSRRSRKTRYRKPRFDNRRKPEGWLPPSLESRVANIITWVKRLVRWCPVSAISLELVKFDTQKLQNPEISGVEYQQGTLFGYEIREYLLKKWSRRCAYCGREDVPLEVEHIIPKSRGGTDRVSNLTLACHECNQRKGNMTAAEFGYPHIQAQAEQPLKDAAAVNSTRWAIFEQLKRFNLPVEVGTGGITKYNRVRLGLPKTHWIDAACVGESTPKELFVKCSSVLVIKATGHGRRQRCRTDRYGFPAAHAPRRKKYMGFQTGDLVRAVVPKGKCVGVHVGRIAIRCRPSFKLNGFDVHPKYLKILQRSDGYEYEIHSVSSPGLKAGAPDAI
ncbi:MAG: RNA-guided endonuclease IscB [Infirmifilum uzonense]|uniref:RNA-guided endonuclease IscB n=1 Tax=Infirmifilum uzonense TaxID=1550241 RepID=UPI003C748529